MIVRVFLLLCLFGQLSSGQKALICGVCRNIEDSLANMQADMEAVGSLFDDYRILIYENNSTDNTKELLTHWKAANPKVICRMEMVSFSEEALTCINIHYPHQFFFFPDKISRARNIVLEMSKQQSMRDYQYVIWMDMDFLDSVNIEAVKETLESTCDWDGVFAYGTHPRGHYFDWYASRTEAFPFGPELLGMYWWKMKKTIDLSPTDPWYPVYSGFGGMAIYKAESLKNATYSPIIDKDVEWFYHDLLKVIKPSHYSYNLYRNMSGYPKKKAPLLAPPSNKISYTKRAYYQLHRGTNALLWTIQDEARNYPAICEHVHLHAQMRKNGHGKFFINPRLTRLYWNK